MIGGIAVGLLNDEIIQLVGGYLHLAEDLILYAYRLVRTLEANHHGLADLTGSIGVGGSGQRIGTRIVKGSLIVLGLVTGPSPSPGRAILGRG